MRGKGLQMPGRRRLSILPNSSHGSRNLPEHVTVIPTPELRPTVGYSQQKLEARVTSFELEATLSLRSKMEPPPLKHDKVNSYPTPACRTAAQETLPGEVIHTYIHIYTHTYKLFSQYHLQVYLLPCKESETRMLVVMEAP